MKLIFGSNTSNIQHEKGEFAGKSGDISILDRVQIRLSHLHQPSIIANLAWLMI